MARMLIVQADGSIIPATTEADLAHAYRDEHQIVWLDFTGPPTPEQQALLIELFGFREGAIEHLVEPHRGPRSTPFRAYMLIVAFDVDFSADALEIERAEVVVLFTDRYVITVHDEITDLGPSFDVRVDRALDRFGVEVGAIVFAVLESIVDRYLPALEGIEARVDLLERRVLQQEEQESITQLYHLRRQLTQLRGVIAPEAALIGLRTSPAPYITNPDITDAMLDIKHKMQRAVDEIDQYLAILPNILTTFESLKSDNLNRIVKLLTVWSIILTAVALFPTVLGISLAREPSISPFAGYIVSIATMVLAGTMIWYLFKRRGWID